MPCVRAFDLPHAFLVPLGTNWKGRIEGPGLRGSMAPSGYVACAALKPAGSEGPIGDRIGLLHRGPGISTAIIPPARAAGRGGDGQLHLRIAHRGPAVDRCGPDPALVPSCTFPAGFWPHYPVQKRRIGLLGPNWSIGTCGTRKSSPAVGPDDRFPRGKRGVRHDG
jgi:hypothetical protein